MDPRLVAATDREVVVLYRQRGCGQTESGWTWKPWACTRCGMASLPERRCFTSTPRPYSTSCASRTAAATITDCDAVTRILVTGCTGRLATPQPQVPG